MFRTFSGLSYYFQDHICAALHCHEINQRITCKVYHDTYKPHKISWNLDFRGNFRNIFIFFLNFEENNIVEWWNIFFFRASKLLLHFSSWSQWRLPHFAIGHIRFKTQCYRNSKQRGMGNLSIVRDQMVALQVNVTPCCPGFKGTDTRVSIRINHLRWYQRYHSKIGCTM